MMKRFTPLALMLLSIICSVGSFATTDKYRVIFRADPATTATIGFNVINGSGVQVYWDTIDHGTNVGAYPNSGSPSRTVSHKGMNNNFVRLTGLQPDQEYYFVVSDNNSTSARFWFRTCPNVSTQRLSFVAGGDSRNNQTQRRNGNMIVRSLRPHAVFFGGDMTNSNTNGEWQTWFDDWQFTTGVDGRMIPIVAARGNHESSNNDIHNLFDTPSSSVYYALTFGGNLLRAYTLNTETTIGGAQTTWLGNDLTANSSVRWKSAQYHKPIRPHVGSKSEGTNQYNNWAPLFQQHQVKLVVECDAHTVKSTYPVIPFTGTGSDEGFIRDDSLGTVFVGEGCWGAPLRNADDAKNWTRASGQFNQVKWVFVDACRIEVRTIRTDNASSVGTVNDNNIFAAPANLDIWNPSSGDVIYIDHVTAPSVAITLPTNGQTYPAIQQIAINATASSPTTITQVNFYYNDTLIGSDATLPYSVNWTPPHNGSYNLTAEVVDLNCNVFSEKVNVSFGPVAQSFCMSTSDEAEEGHDGSINQTSSDIELVDDGTDNQFVGLQWTNVTIPRGVRIISAYVQFQADESHSGTTNLLINGEFVPNSANISSVDFNVSARKRTEAQVAWSPAAWTTGQAGPAQQTPDISAIIQEIVDQYNWVSGNTVSLVFTGSGRRTAEKSPAPQLCINYILGGTNIGPKAEITSPVNYDKFFNWNAIPINVDAYDPDGNVTKVDFFVNGSLAGTDNTFPYSLSWSPTAFGDYQVVAVVTDDSSATGVSDTVNLSVINSNAGISNFAVRVAGSSDDAEEEENGAVSTGSTDLEITYDGNNGSRQWVGMRFNNVTVPQGAVITNAYIQFTVDEGTSGDIRVWVQGEASDNAGTFTTTNADISSRPLTNASVEWTPANWPTVGVSGSAQQTPDLRPIVQEIVNRPGWGINNSMAFVVYGDGKRVSESVDGSSTQAPQLIIDYTQLVVGMNEFTSGEYKLFPNPTSGLLEVITKAELKNIVVYSLNGQLMRSKDQIGSTRANMNISDLAKGVYLVKVTTTDKEYFDKIVLR